MGLLQAPIGAENALGDRGHDRIARRRSPAVGSAGERLPTGIPTIRGRARESQAAGVGVLVIARLAATQPVRLR